MVIKNVMIVIILPHAFFLNPAAPFSVEKKRLLPIRKGGRTISPAAKKNGAGLAIFRQSAIVISGRRDVGSPMSNLLRILAPALALCVFLPVAAWIGFRNQEMIAVLIMLGSPTTPTSYIMAKQMAGEGDLSGSIVVIATLCSAVTLTGWIFVLKSFGLLG